MEVTEKAQELVDKFNPFVYCYMGSGFMTNTYNARAALLMQKECAKISVDEIIKEYERLSSNKQTNVITVMEINYNYWNKVKIEIDNCTETKTK